MNIYKLLAGLVSILALCVFFIVFSASCCGNNCDPTCTGPEFCSEPSVTNSGLNVEFLNHQLDDPIARYSVIFKVDQDNNPITDLMVSDIVVTDNGEELPYEADKGLIPDTRDFEFNIMLLIDMSESIIESNTLPKVKSAMKSFIDAVLPENNPSAGDGRIAIYFYDGDPDIVLLRNFTSNRDELISTIDNINSSLTRDGSTNLYGAVIEGANTIESTTNNSTKLAKVGSMIIFTDGTDLAGIKSEMEAISRISEITSSDSRIDVYTIGLGEDIDNNVLTNLGLDGFFYAENIDLLTPTFQQIGMDLYNEVNSYYKVEYCSPRRNGNTVLKIIIKKNGESSEIQSCINSSCTPDPCP